MSDASKNATRHSHCANGVESPTYRSWKAMKRRCGNAEFAKYECVSYDPQWSRFDAFLIDMGERPDGHTLDRIDNNLGYSKENCRWATRHQQNQNRRFVVLSERDARMILSHKGAGATAKEIAMKFGCSACNVRDIWAGRAWGDLK